MNIYTTNACFTCNKNKFNQFRNLNIDNNDYRTSFYGEKAPITKSKNVKIALDVAENLTTLNLNDNFSKEEIEKLLNKNSPVPIEVHDISEIPNEIKQSMSGKINAFMRPYYNENLKLAQADIYIDFQKGKKKQGVLIADIAHEFTHVLQRADDKNYHGVRNYTKDFNLAVIIARNSQSIMQKSIGECARQIYNGDLRLVQQIISDRIDGKYNTSEHIKGINISNDIDNISQNLSFNFKKNKKDMKRAISEFIKKECNNEIEAYAVTDAVLDKLDKHNIMDRGIINSDIHRFIKNSL